MKFDLETFKSVANGTVSIEEKNGLLYFNRFTKNQEAVYKDTNLYGRASASTGISLMFETDSTSVFLTAVASVGTSRTYFSFEIYKNEKLIGRIKNFDGEKSEQEPRRTMQEYPLGEYSGKFELGKGIKTVRIEFPWSVAVGIKELALDDEAYIKPVKYEKKLIVFGDSITQGYDALFPSGRYISKIAAALKAEEYNKAVGGAVYNSQLAEDKEAFEPDYILVSYGSNDWNVVKSLEEYETNCRAFLAQLSANYLSVKIFVLSPIWRNDSAESKPMGEFEQVAKSTKIICSEINNTIFINGTDLVPHDINNFADFNLHPNDYGFEFYADNLLAEIKKHI